MKLRRLDVFLWHSVGLQIISGLTCVPCVVALMRWCNLSSIVTCPSNEMGVALFSILPLSNVFVSSCICSLLFVFRYERLLGAVWRDPFPESEDFRWNLVRKVTVTLTTATNLRLIMCQKILIPPRETNSSCDSSFLLFISSLNFIQFIHPTLSTIKNDRSIEICTHFVPDLI